MSVSDPTTIDQVATSPDGRVVLVMTEDRPYAGSDVAALTEQLRVKLNGYVGMIRSGQLASVAGPQAADGADILLLTVDDPPAEVAQLVTLARQGLADEGVGVQQQLLDPPTPDTVLAALADSVAGRAPAGWQAIDISVVIIGEAMAGGMVAQLGTERHEPMDPDETMIQALQLLKTGLWTEQTGSWISILIHIEHSGEISRAFNYDEEPPDAEFPPAEYARELEAYPRPTVPQWWQRRLLT